MPVKLDSKLPTESAEARIEIIPLIDIMFFLLAAFMLVSLSMVNLKSVKVDLPQAANSSADNSKDLSDVSVDKSGGIYLNSKPIGTSELVRTLLAAKRANPNLRVMIDGDRDARYGQIIHVEDLVRAAGIDRVTLDIQPQEATSK